jgi:uncharacterized DUF497 family protein
MDRLFEHGGTTFEWDEAKAAIGFSSAGRLLTVVHIEFDGQSIRIISAWRASPAEEEFYDQ